jgi:hypothetical protein
MFVEMIIVTLLEALQKPSEGPKSWRPRADLEIDEIRAAVFTHQHVFGFVEVDVSHAALMNLCQQIVEFMEEGFPDVRGVG